MIFDVFFSLAQSPRNNVLPSHKQFFVEFVDQVVLADELGFDCAWVAESHFSSEIQKGSESPVIPDWQGEVGLNTDFFQLANVVLRKTKRIGVGSAILNIIASGGPLCVAERVASLYAWEQSLSSDPRQLKIGYASGRFDYINRISNITPRNSFEWDHWKLIKSHIFREANEIFLRALCGEAISSDDIQTQTVKIDNGREIDIENRWTFEKTKLVPDFDRQYLDLTVGTQDAHVQMYANTISPVKVFNLSVTSSDVIESTHLRMQENFHKDGGPWRRSYMPRTVLVFLCADEKLSDDQQRARANEQAQRAIAAFWNAMEGTIDPYKVTTYAQNALIGNPYDIANQLASRFNENDRIMLWFDFFSESCEQVLSSMTAFKQKVIPYAKEILSREYANNP